MVKKRPMRDAPRDGSVIKVIVWERDKHAEAGGYWVVGSAYFDGKHWRWRVGYDRCAPNHWIDYGKKT